MGFAQFKSYSANERFKVTEVAFESEGATAKRKLLLTLCTASFFLCFAAVKPSRAELAAQAVSF